MMEARHDAGRARRKNVPFATSDLTHETMGAAYYETVAA